MIETKAAVVTLSSREAVTAAESAVAADSADG